MAHEQTETVQDPKTKKWLNVYGKGTKQAGQPVRRLFDWEEESYQTVEAAEAAARRRSQEAGQLPSGLRRLLH